MEPWKTLDYGKGLGLTSIRADDVMSTAIEGGTPILTGNDPIREPKKEQEEDHENEGANNPWIPDAVEMPAREAIADAVKTALIGFAGIVILAAGLLAIFLSGKKAVGV